VVCCVVCVCAWVSCVCTYVCVLQAVYSSPQHYMGGQMQGPQSMPPQTYVPSASSHNYSR
jgi:hypothetical protein